MMKNLLKKFKEKYTTLFFRIKITVYLSLKCIKTFLKLIIEPHYLQEKSER